MHSTTRVLTSISNLQSIRTLLLMVSVLTALTFTSALQAQDTPSTAVRTVVNNILEILRSPDFDFAADRPAIRAEIRRAFDDVAMAQSVLSTNWKQASDAQQEQFKELLMQTIESTYIGRIRAYTNESVKFGDEDIRGKRAEVSTAIEASSGEIPITYKLRERSDGWFVYDVEIENVSMVSTYRETYRSIVKRSGMDGLLSQMQEKIVELESRTGA